MATMRIVAAPMKVAHISKAGGRVRIKVEACDICHNSVLITGGLAQGLVDAAHRVCRYAGATGGDIELITKITGVARALEVQYV